MTMTIAVYSMKDGVGKSTLTLLWDIDAQGAASLLCAQERPQAKARRVFAREVAPAALVEPTRWPAIPHASVIERMAVEQAPVTAYAPSSPAAPAFSEPWQTIDGLLAGNKKRAVCTLPRIPKTHG